MQDRTVSGELSKVLGGGLRGDSTVEGLGSTLTSVVDTGISSVPGTAGSNGATGGSASSGLVDALAQTTAQLAQVRSTLQGQLDSIAANTQALIDNTSRSGGTGAAVASAAGSMASNVLGGGLLGPIVSGLMGLFGSGGDSQAQSPLVKFALPPPVQFDAGVQGSTASGVDYAQNDKPRSTSPAATAPPITVNVSAMDSRSFLDHSSDIANAVRRAMLESSSLNDVIGDM